MHVLMFLPQYQDIEDKILDEDHREILNMLTTIHTLELQLAGARMDMTSLEKVVEEQGHWLRSHNQLNLDLLEMVKMQQHLLQSNKVELTPELKNLHRYLLWYDKQPEVQQPVRNITSLWWDTNVNWNLVR